MNKQQAQEEIEEAERRLQGIRRRLSQPGRGDAPQTLDARVVDPGLREALKVKDTIPLKFEMVEWVPARFSGGGITVYMEGEFRQSLGTDDLDTAPLLVKFREGKGTVIFTSFHNETVNSEIEEGLLRYLVFAAVTAKEEEAVAVELSKGGFSPPTRSRLGTHSPGSPSVPGNYVTREPGPVRFALTLGGEGALLKFTLHSPDGQTFERQVKSSTIIEAVGAPVGEWTYEVTAIDVPYDNFVWSVGVSEGGSSAEPDTR